MLDKAQIDGQIASFGESLHGDANLFALVDLRLPPEEQIPRVMIGVQAEGMLRNGHYHAVFVGENSSSVKNRRQERIEKAKAINPDLKAPQSVAQQLADAQAELAALKADKEAKAAEKEAEDKAKAEAKAAEAAAKAAEKEAGKGGK